MWQPRQIKLLGELGLKGATMLQTACNLQFILLMLACTYAIAFLYTVNISEIDVRTSNLGADNTVGIISHVFTPHLLCLHVDLWQSNCVDILYVVMIIKFFLLCASSVSRQGCR